MVGFACSSARFGSLLGVLLMHDDHFYDLVATVTAGIAFLIGTTLVFFLPENCSAEKLVAFTKREKRRTRLRKGEEIGEVEMVESTRV